MALTDFLIIKVNGEFERFEYKFKTVWILYIETEEKIHLCEGAGIEGDFAKDEGWLLQDQTQARRQDHGKGAQEQYSTKSIYSFLTQFHHEEYSLFLYLSGYKFFILRVFS